MKRKVTLILISLLFVLFVYASYLIWSKELANSFQYTSIAFLISKESSSFLFPIDPTSYIAKIVGPINVRPGTEILVFLISEVSGFSPQELQFFPLGGFCFLLSYFVFNNKLHGDIVISLLLTIFLSFLIFQDPLLITTYVHTWAFPIYLLAIVSYIMYMKSMDTRYFVLLFFFYLGAHLFYYTVQFWIIIFTLLSPLILVLLKQNSQYKPRGTIFLIFITIFLGFNKVFYFGFLPKVRDSDISFMFSSSIDMILGFFLHENSIVQEKYIWTGVTSNYTHAYSALIILFIIIFICFLGLKDLFISYFKKQKFDVHDIFFLSLILTGIIDTISYTVIGFRLLTRFFFFFYPVLAMYTLKKRGTNSNKIYLVLFILVILSSLNYISFVKSPYIESSSSSYKDIEPSTQYLFRHTQTEFKLLSDHKTVGVFMVNGVEYERLNPVYYDEKSYSSFIGDNYSYVADYFVVDLNKIESPLESGWNKYEPLSKHVTEINNNLNIEKIYYDNNIVIFRNK